MAQRYKRVYVCFRFDFHSGDIIIFSFLRTVTKVKALCSLNSANRHAMPQKFGKKWGMESLNTKFPDILCLPRYMEDTNKKVDKIAL